MDSALYKLFITNDDENDNDNDIDYDAKNATVVPVWMR